MQKFIIFALLIGTISGWSAFFISTHDSQQATSVPVAERGNAEEKTSQKKLVTRASKSTDEKEEPIGGEFSPEEQRELLKSIQKTMDEESQEQMKFYSEMLGLNEFQVKRLAEISREFNQKMLQFTKWVYQTEQNQNGNYDEWFSAMDAKHSELMSQSIDNRLAEILDENQQAKYENYRNSVKNAEAEAYAAMMLADDLKKESLSEEEKNERFSDYAKKALLNDAENEKEEKEE